MTQKSSGLKYKLTDRYVKNLKAPSSGRVEIYDTLLPAFGLRVGSSGRRAFFVRYRVHGKEMRETLGAYPVMSLDDARTKAREKLGLATAGTDPRRRTKPKRGIFALVAEEFIERDVVVHRKPSTQKDYIRHVRKRLIPNWGHMLASAITTEDVNDLLDAIVDGGQPILANRVLATTKALFNWAMTRKYVTQSPAAVIKPPGKEKSRKRKLSREEIHSIWNACEAMDYPFGPFVQMMFATGGQRTGDVQHMRWEDIHADQWVIPNPTKSDEEEDHSVPLSTLAMDVLKPLPHFDGSYVFTTTGGEKPVSGFSKGKKRLDKLSGVANWRLHDIRRTVSTAFGNDLRLHPYIAEMVQNRKSGTIKGVLAVYNRADYEKDKREALEAWADHIRGILASNVVQLRG